MKQVYVVILETEPAFERQFPKVESERMANIIRDAVHAKSCSFLGPVPFRIMVARADDVASAEGEMREYVEEEFAKDIVVDKALVGDLAS